jgi:hypothetical protein
VRLGFDAEGAVNVRLCIPQGQPPGHYAGLVVDRDTGDPLGTLSVRVGN